MKHFLFVIIACFLCFAALAQEPNQVFSFVWDLPTKRVSGLPLAKEEIKTIELSYSVDGGKSTTHTLGPSTATYRTTAFYPAGKHLMVAKARVQDSKGVWSDYAVVNYEFETESGKPESVGNFRIEMTCEHFICKGQIKVD